MMKKIIIGLLFSLTLVQAQVLVDTVSTDSGQTVTFEMPNCKFYNLGDTIVNLNSLNNGIKKYQISKEDSLVIVNNGLAIQKGGTITLVTDSLLKKNFSFFIKTFAADNEWYENTAKIHVRNGVIVLVNITTDKIEMATGFRKEGKIYVVVAVSMILFFTVIFYLIYLERKVKKLEKSINSK